MKLSFRKTQPAPTLADRHEEAASRAASALAGFEYAASSLEAAAAEQDAVAADIQSEIDTLIVLREAACDHALVASTAANKIRALVS